MRIGVMLPNWIGDVVMATPTLRALYNWFGPDVQITGVMRPYVSQVLEGTPWINKKLTYDRRSKNSNYRCVGVSKALRQLDVEWIFVLPNSLRAGAIAWLSGARQRTGYVRNGRGLLLNRSLRPLRNAGRWKPVSAVDYYLKLAYLAGCPPSPQHLELETTTEEERQADRVWDRLGLWSASQVVALNTGGAYGTSKNWPVEYFVELAQRISDETNANVLVLCGPQERRTADEIEYRARRPQVKSLAKDDLSIGLLKACIRRSTLLVTTDSGPRHFAAAFNIPSVALFGSQDPRWSTNYHPQEILLQHQVPCGPCGQRTCPLVHHQCMHQLSVDRVFQAVQQQTKLNRLAPAA